jgi:membrane-bound ClpP family serine protease
MGATWAFLVCVAPSVGVGLLFWFVMRKVVHADRNEREALARLSAEVDEPAPDTGGRETAGADTP